MRHLIRRLAYSDLSLLRVSKSSHSNSPSFSLRSEMNFSLSPSRCNSDAFCLSGGLWREGGFEVRQSGFHG